MILNKAGIAVFYHNFIDRKTNDIQLVASYFALLCRYTRKNLKLNLKSFTLQDRKFFFYSHKSGLHVVFICEIKSYNDNIFNYLGDIIIKKFLKLYKKQLNNFNGEISLFKPFSKVLEHTINPKFIDINAIAATDF